MQTLTKSGFFRLLHWIIEGKTLTRAMLSIRLGEEGPMQGLVVDLGGGGVPSYLGQIRIDGEFINMDRAPEVHPTLVGDLEKGVPLAPGVADHVLLFNTLEHLYDHKRVFAECFRVIKANGRLVIYSPFLFPFHTHKFENTVIQDYFRLSESALSRLLAEAGFADTRIEPMGGLFFVIAEFSGFFLRFRFLRVLMFVLCFVLENLYRALRPGQSHARYPLAYWVVARK